MKQFKLSLLTTAIVLSGAAYAETNDVETIEVKGVYLEGYNAHDASGASRLELDIIEIPQSVSVITAAQIEDFQLYDLDDALDSATGVNVERVETDRTYYTARGFQITNFQVDGVGLPLSSDINYSSEDTATYERVEVIRGANGLMTGVGNPSATINFIRKRPTTADGLDISVTGGSWNRHRVELDGSYNLTDNTAVRAVVVDGGGDSYLDRYEEKKGVYYLALTHDFSDRTELYVSHSISNNDADDVMWGAMPLHYQDGTPTEFDPSFNPAADWTYWDVELENTAVELSHILSNNWQIRASYSHKTRDEDSELFYLLGRAQSSNSLQGLQGWYGKHLSEETSDLFDLYLSGEFEFLGREHEFVAGGNYASIDLSGGSVNSWTPSVPGFGEGWTGDIERPDFGDIAQTEEMNNEQSSVYFTVRFSITDELHLITGGRQNTWKAEGKYYSTVNDIDDSQFIPYIGGVYEFADGVVAYGSYTETFVSQQKYDVNGNMLDPITGKSHEVGIKASGFDSKLLTTFTYFNSEQDNVAKADSRCLTPENPQECYVGVQGLQSSGFELDMVGEFWSGLQTNLGITFIDIDGDDQIRDYTPEKMVKLAAIYQVPFIEGLSVGVNARWQDGVSRAQSDKPEFVTEQGSYAVVDLMARYEVNDRVSVSVNVDNVTDEEYLTSLYWDQAYYGAPTNVSATLSIKL